MESHLPNIPQELVLEEILPRLPAKSLSRFRWVSKTWYAVISDPKFSFKIKTHRIAGIPSHGYQVFYGIDYESCTSEQHRPPFLSGYYGILRVFSSYKGLLLLGVGPSVFLFNPSTREYSKLDVLSLYYNISFVAICYDLSTCDYKVLAEIGSTSMTPPYDIPMLKLYSNRTQSWKYLESPRHFDGFRHCVPVIDEKLHLLAYQGERRSSDEEDEDDDGRRESVCVGDGDEVRRDIFYFDASEEIFVGLPSPQPKHGTENDIVSLFAIDGCLAMARQLDDGRDSCKEMLMEVLVMKEYGVKESWNLLFTLSNFNGWIPCTFYPLHLSSNGELLATIYRRGSGDAREKIIAYNIEKGTYRDVFVEAEGYLEHAVVYTESLVRPTDIICDMAEESQ